MQEGASPADNPDGEGATERRPDVTDAPKCPICGSRFHDKTKCWVKPVVWALAAVIILSAAAAAWLLTR